ncbi:hypothetical protein HYV86_03030 [Candidatus Woesearchaeota archaeon]|nr:hypothetical protein [Candidatus Woesearchaeota archaeon]
MKKPKSNLVIRLNLITWSLLGFIAIAILIPTSLAQEEKLELTKEMTIQELQEQHDQYKFAYELDENSIDHESQEWNSFADFENDRFEENNSDKEIATGEKKELQSQVQYPENTPNLEDTHNTTLLSLFDSFLQLLHLKT